MSLILSQRPRPDYLNDVPLTGLSGARLNSKLKDIPVDATILGYGNIIPSDPKEVEKITACLNDLNVRFEVVELIGGGGIFIISDKEIHKLPKDQEGPYLPATKDSGHKLIAIRQSILDSFYISGAIREQNLDLADDLISTLKKANVVVIEAPQISSGVVFALKNIAEINFCSELQTIEPNGFSNSIGEEEDSVAADSQFQAGILESSLAAGKIVLIDDASKLSNFELEIVQQYVQAMQNNQTSFVLSTPTSKRQINISDKAKLVLRYQEIDDAHPIFVNLSDIEQLAAAVAEVGIPEEQLKRVLQTVGDAASITFYSWGPSDLNRMESGIWAAWKDGSPAIFQLASNHEFHVALPKESIYEVAKRALGIGNQEVDELISRRVIHPKE